MKLTSEQLVILQDSLRERIVYEETYQEVYDHVLTALEHTEDSVPLAQALDNIMRNEFGGIRGLRAIERKQNWSVAREIINSQLSYFMDNFQPRFIAITVCIYAVVYFCVVGLRFTPGHMILYFMAMSMIAICSAYRYYKNGYKFIGVDRSIKHSSLMYISMAPFIIFAGGFLIVDIVYYKITHHRIFDSLNMPSGIISLLFTFYIIYCIAFFRLYRDEFTKSQIK